MRTLTIILTLILILATTIGWVVSLLGGIGWLLALFTLLEAALGYVLVTLLD